METNNHFKFSLDCDINNGERKIDRLRANLLQLQTVLKEVGGGVMLERQKELLKQYGHEIDREMSKNTKYSGPNTWIDMRRNFKVSDARSFQADTWKCHLSKDIKASKVTSAQLIEQFNPALMPFQDVSQRWKDLEKKKFNMLKYINREISDDAIKSEKIDISVTESKPAPPKDPVVSARSKIVSSTRGSPVRCSGLFHPRNRSKEIKENPTSNSWNNFNPSNYQDNNKLTTNTLTTQPTSSTSAKNSFVTGLEKRYMDQVTNSEKTAKQAFEELQQSRNRIQAQKCGGTKQAQANENPLLSDERLQNIEPEMIKLIQAEIVTNLDGVGWAQISGLKSAKAKIQEIAIMPLLRPDLFKGLRSPPKGLKFALVD